MLISDEERIALLLDYENLAIGARESGYEGFDLPAVNSALADRGRVVVRRAYGDWNLFDGDRRMLVAGQVELIEIPQRIGATRKNAADIKMAVDALELAFARDYITTFVIGTGDSDFTPLVSKLRELNKRVIGLGIEQSTSALLPPACDEFLFYGKLDGVESLDEVASRPGRRRPRRLVRGRSDPRSDDSTVSDEAKNGRANNDNRSSGVGGRSRSTAEADTASDSDASDLEDATVSSLRSSSDVALDLGRIVVQTLAGLNRVATGPVTASMLKQAILRKDPTFDESDAGFRGFGELLNHLRDRHIVTLEQGPAIGDPEVSFAEHTGEERDAFSLLQSVVQREAKATGSGRVVLSGLKTLLRREDPSFSEKDLGFRAFRHFCRAAQSRGLIDMEWSDDLDDYAVWVPAS